MLSGEEFGRLFETCERTAFRLETLAVYDVEEEREDFERFLAGGDMAGGLQSSLIVRRRRSVEAEEGQWPLVGAEGCGAESGGDVGVAGVAELVDGEAAGR
ncbi:DUF6879 family protein, partial [Streptomyces sp. ISL-86]|uniref:DUF6879 family protein n=1 Tax=Streptomyces sp. ISL-86 TaxID=2819187 RepID=UPI001C18E96B|nr:hypothetical protein [Streptomyces sp. ISL-86]